MAVFNRCQVALSTCFTLLLVVYVLPGYGATGKSEWPRPPHDLKVVCYVSTWANYRQYPATFTIDNIDPSLCTHLMYSFVGLDNETLTMISLDPWTDLDPEEGGRGYFRQMTNLKNQYPHLTVMLAVGGYNEGSESYSRMASSYETRHGFIASALGFLQKYGFDGLDLDWEYPTLRGGDLEDRQNFVSLVAELRAEFDRFGGLKLSTAIGASPQTMASAYDIPALTNNLDLFNIMAYDYHGSWDNKTGCNAPLYAQDDLWSVADTLWYLQVNGAPMQKVMLGLPSYGHTFIMDAPGSQEMGAPCSNVGFAGPYTEQKGFFSYQEICLDIQNPKWTHYWDDNTGTPYMIANEQFISYDDEQSLTLKVDYAVRFGVGGVMMWSMDSDDFLGSCSADRNQYPLLKRINQAVVDTLGSMKN